MKLTLSDLANLTNENSAIAAINNNNALIETALENTLSRDGTSPNTMEADLDMNSNSILNLPDPTTDQEPATKSYVDHALENITNAEVNFDDLQEETSPDMASDWLLLGDVSTGLNKKIHPRTILNPVVSVKYYGAVGDGVTDDTAAIQAALNASNHISIPPGVYRTTSALNLSNYHVVEGFGKGFTSVWGDFSGNTFQAVTKNTYGMVLRGFEIRGNGSEIDGSGATSVGLWINSPNEETAHIYLEDMRFLYHNYGVAGDDTFTMFDSVLNKVDFYGCQQVGMNLQGSQNTFTGCTFRLCNYGVNVDSPANPSIGGGGFFGCTWVSNTYDIVIATPICRPLSFYNCWFEQNETAVIGTTEAGEVTFYSLSFQNCLFQPSATSATTGIMVGFASFKGPITFQNCIGISDLFASTAFPDAASSDSNSQVQTINCAILDGSSVMTILDNSLGDTSILGTLYPYNNDVGTLGTSAKGWSDLYLASGAIIDFANNNARITHTNNLLTSNVPFGADSFIPTDSVVPSNGIYLPASNTIGFAINGAGEVQLTSTALSPITSDGNALGTSSLMWSDLFLADGGVLNFNNGNVTLTHSTSTLAFGIGGSEVYRIDSNGNMGLGVTGGPFAGVTAGRRYLSIKGSSLAGVLQLSTAASDADGLNTGLIEFHDATNAKRVAYITTTLSGTTANNRGAKMAFGVKLDNSSTINETLVLDAKTNVIIGTNAALATNATDGFLHIPTSAGAPSGTPNGYTGKVALQYDTTNNRLYVYNGAWKQVALA